MWDQLNPALLILNNMRVCCAEASSTPSSSRQSRTCSCSTLCRLWHRLRPILGAFATSLTTTSSTRRRKRPRSCWPRKRSSLRTCHSLVTEASLVVSSTRCLLTTAKRTSSCAFLSWISTRRAWGVKASSWVSPSSRCRSS